MRIGLDFDGVIADCAQLKSKAAKALYGIKIAPDRCKRELVLGDGLLSHEQYCILLKTVYSNRQMNLTMRPVRGAIRYLSRILRDGDSVVVITSRGTEEVEIARTWSVRHGLELEFVGVGGGRTKAEAAKGVDLYVDDDFEKLEPLVGIVASLVLFSWPYNEHLECSGVATRVTSWSQLYRTIRNGR